jgi:riboflavin synthase
VNGVCLTVVENTACLLHFQAGPETLARTTLAYLSAGHRVNLEPALKMGDTLGGHIVTGHVDTVGTVESIREDGDWRHYAFALSKDHDDLLVKKGSIAVDGISLTLVDVEPGRFTVMVIPHTRDHTTLGVRHPGDRVNLEFDLIAKHVQKLFNNLTINI